MRLGALAVCALSIAAISCPPVAAQRTAAQHPLDPLSADEISRATSALRQAGQLQPSVRFVILETEEPNKARVAQAIGSGRVARVARAVLYDWNAGATIETRVDLATSAVISTNSRVTEPPVRHVILSRATEVALADERVVRALKQAGVARLDRLTFLVNLPEGAFPRRRGNARLVNASPYLWDEVGDAASVPVNVLIDLTAGVVESVQEPRFGAGGPRRTPRTDADSGLPSLRLSQPQGPGFQIHGSEIEWDRWRLHVGIHPRRGLEIFDVAWRDGQRYRSVLYRASLSELITPYGDPSFTTWYPRDEGDYGMTSYSAARAQAIIGADAPEHATFLPATIADTRGQPVTIDRAVAVYERDAGVLWRHAAEGRRARQLVLSSYNTIDNYDYLFHWIFSQDGAIDVQVQLTGVMNTTRGGGPHDPDDETPQFGHLVAPGVRAPNHQHFFAWRLDFDVDGVSNRVLELNTTNPQADRIDRAAEYFGMAQRTLRGELEARRDLDFATARRWLVANHGRMNSLGQPAGYALIPGENAPPFPGPATAARRRAAFLNHHLWVTRYDPTHMYASGEWVNLGGVNEGVATWSQDDESIVDADAVVWYTLSVLHVPRPEDWPIMPAHTAGFRLMPVGFFDRNPTLQNAP
jgi:primary-amine oxidase